MNCITCDGANAAPICAACVNHVAYTWAAGQEAAAQRAGVAAYVGLMGMFGMLAARERAKPIAPDPEVQGCNRRHPSGGSVRCNLLNDHEGPHKKIGRTGAVNYSWPNVERAAADT